MLHIAICIATRQRPQLLAELLESLRTQALPEHCYVDLRIVDNDALASARAVVEAFQGRSHPYQKVVYRVQPEQNIAIARNTALEIGPANLLIFVDDDEVAQADWLKELVAAFRKTGADGIFGPVRGRLENPKSPKWLGHGGFFDKSVPPTGTPVSWKETRTSNTLVKGHWFYGKTQFRFDSRLGRSGGSDSALFARLQENGARFVSCSEAVVSEIVPPQRASLAWLCQRWYRNGLIYEGIARASGREPHPLVRFCRRLLAASLHAIIGILPFLFNRPEHLARAALRLSLACGGLRSWISPQSLTRHVAYAPEAQKSQRRVAFLTNIVSPYRAPVFRALAQTPNWSLRVFVDSKTEFDRNWNVDTTQLDLSSPLCLSWKRIVRSAKPAPFKQVITLHLPIGLFFALARYRPHSVISHELGARSLVAVLYCALFRVPLTLWAYQSRISSEQGSWRNRFRSFLLKRADTVIGMGTQARDVLRKWGVPDHKIHDAPNAADASTIHKRLSERNAPLVINRIRFEHALERKLAIVVGRLIPLKGIESLLDTWKQLPEATRRNWTLAFIGDGPLAPRIRQSEDPSIHLVGPVPSQDMAYWYAAADLHIFPSQGDVWGLVVNEASHCGTPSLCSVHAGCCDDLIQHGENGLAIDFANAKRAAVELNHALNREDLFRLGIAARHKIAPYTPQAMAERFRQAACQSDQTHSERKTYKLKNLQEA